MKYSDIEKIQQAGLISEEQRQKINEHFRLKEEGSRFLSVIATIGALLVACGVALLIAANWDDIPRLVKVGGALALMLGAHAAGWYLREIHGGYPKIGEALHLIGSALFLCNIALIGQVYHISSRPPNALGLWCAGIAALPWLLRSRVQFGLLLIAVAIWFGFEINQQDSLIFFGEDQRQVLVYSLLGLSYLGLGYCLRRTAFASFGSDAEQLGLMLFLGFAFPLTWDMWGDHYHRLTYQPWILPAFSVAALVLLAAGLYRLDKLEAGWRWIWGLALAAMVLVIAGAYYLPGHLGSGSPDTGLHYYWLCAGALFAFCLLQVQVAIKMASPPLLNYALVFLVLDIIATYINLFGSMTRTGLIFLAGGVFLILFGIWLEKKRRELLRQIKVSAN